MHVFFLKKKELESRERAIINHIYVSSFSRLRCVKKKAVYIIFGKEAEVLIFVRLYYLRRFSCSKNL